MSHPEVMAARELLADLERIRYVNTDASATVAFWAYWSGMLAGQLHHMCQVVEKLDAEARTPRPDDGPR